MCHWRDINLQMTGRGRRGNGRGRGKRGRPRKDEDGMMQDVIFLITNLILIF